MDSDPGDKDFTLSGIAHGFHLVNDLSTVSSADCKNYRSAENPDVKPALDKLFHDELCSHRIQEVPHKPLRVNAIGCVIKKDSGDPRPITDMSRPLNNSVNDHIPCESYRYKTIDDAIALLHPGCYFATIDIKSAYRWVPVYPPPPPIAHFKDSAGPLMDLTNSLQTIFSVLVSKMRPVFFTGFPAQLPV